MLAKMYIFIFSLICILTISSLKFGDITNRKCIEYSNFVYETEQSGLTLLPLQRAKRVSRCNIEANPLIVGGEEAKIMEFPHMAIIGFGKTPKSNLVWGCGGSLISLHFILTAAHCIKSDDGMAQKVRLGTINLESTDDSINEFLIKNRYMYPKYDSISGYHDIGLIQLNNYIHPGQYIRPACLNTNIHLNLKKAVAIGFGKLDFSDSSMSNKLMKVVLDTVDNKTCQKIYKSFLEMKKGVLRSQLCAGLAAGKDACQGDSGGPFQRVLDKPYCMYEIIAITSTGMFCGFENSPGIYTKVAYYIPWIEKIVWIRKAKNN